MSNLKDMYHKIVNDDFPNEFTINFNNTVLKYKKRTWNIDNEERGLRYGENPDQPAALYEYVEGNINIDGKDYRAPKNSIVSTLSEAQMLQAGKHPGKTNLTDVDNGINILQYLTKKPAAIILKHNNPSGAAWSDISLNDALNKAYNSDRIAAFGGAVVVNRNLDKESAQFLSSAYFEVVAAPSFDKEALEILSKRKNLRILQLEQLANLEKYAYIPFLDIKSLTDGGLVLQQSFVNKIKSVEDFIPASAKDKENNDYIARSPNKQEAEDLLFAWAVEAGVTSNSVIFARNGATVAIGTGEQDRVGCIELAIHKAYTKYADQLVFKKYNMSLYELQLKALHSEQDAKNLAEVQEEARKAKADLPGTVMVSDGFFPFRDGVDLALAQGVTAIAQPGGSIRDFEVIQACNEGGCGMVFTAQRSFKH